MKEKSKNPILMLTWFKVFIHTLLSFITDSEVRDSLFYCVTPTR